MTILCGCSFQILCEIDYDDEIYESGYRAHIKLDICKVQRCYQAERRLSMDRKVILTVQKRDR